MEYIAIIDKKEGEAWFTKDSTQAAQLLGVHPDTLRSRLPLWEDRRYLICPATHLKSNRGGRGFIQKAASGQDDW